MRWLPLLLTGCFQASYIAQAARGQFELVDKTRSIPSVLEDESTPPVTRLLLSEVAPIKAYAEAHGLKPTSNYTQYKDLKRPAAVWVVSACEPFRFRSKTWSFPITGAVPYLGWFRINDAKEFASGLREEGYDVSLRTAQAYSTLGWFTDPVLSTMLLRGEDALGDLANTILHESLHATLYLPGKTLLSESIASFVGDEMAHDYLRDRYGEKSKQMKAYVSQKERGAQIATALHEAYVTLQALYASKLSKEEKLQRKRELLVALQRKLRLRISINNALLMEYRSYTSGQSVLAERFARMGRSWPRFIAWLMPLQEKDVPDNMDKALATLTAPSGS